MFKFIAVKGDELKIKNYETKEIMTLSSIEQILKLIEKNKEDIEPDFLLEVLKHVKDSKYYADIFQVSLPVFIRKMDQLTIKQRYNFIAYNVNLMNLKSFKNLIFSLNDSHIIKFYKHYKTSLDMSFQIEIIRTLNKDELKLDFLEQNKDALDIDSQVSIIRSLNKDELKLRFLNNNKNSLDINSQVSIIRSLNKDELKLRFLNNNKNSLDINSQVRIIGTLDTDELKLDFLEQNKDALDIDSQVSIIRSLNKDELKFDFLEQNKDALDVDSQVSIIRSLNKDELKLRFLNNNKNSLDIDSQVRIIKLINTDELKFDFLEQNKDALDIDSQVSIIRLLNKDELKLDFLEQNKDALDVDSQVRIICTLDNDKNKLDFLEQTPNIPDTLKQRLLKSISVKELYKIYNLNEYDAQNLLPVDYILKNVVDLRERVDFINNNIEKFSGKMLDEILGMNNIIQILDEKQNILSSEQIVFLIYNSSPQKQEEYYNKFESKLHDIQKYMLLSTFKTNQSNERKFDGILNGLELSSETKNLSDKILKNFGYTIFFSQNAIALLSQEGLSSFSEDNIYQLFKYCVYTNTMPDISNAIKNNELFEKFQNFRKQNISQNLLDVKNIQNTLLEFNKYTDLIEDCMKGELTEQEQSILISILNDKNIEITSKEDLQNYSTKRSEYVDNLIKTDIDSAIIYLLTGLNQEDYLKKESLFFNDDQLNITLNDFSDELIDEISLMKISKEIISLVQNEPKESKNRILQIFKKDLELEFTSQGSTVADLRNIFPEFETTLRTLYGNELQESLSATQLPPPNQDEDIDIITLNGENFQMLIHGLNAYGQGSNLYENKDVGKAYICTSLISNNCLSRAPADIYYGFKNISKKSLALEGPSDIYSGASTNSLDITANQDVKFLKPDQLLKETKKDHYNEVVLYRDQVDEFGNTKPLMPDYIVAFSDITEHDRQEAKRLNIPIVLINEQKYKSQIEEQKIEQQKETVKNTQKEISSTIFPQLREYMLDIVKNAKNNCSAMQQEAIMVEIKKAFKLYKEQTLSNREDLNV